MRCDPQVTCHEGQASAAGRQCSIGGAFGESSTGMLAAAGAKGGRAADEGMASADAIDGGLRARCRSCVANAISAIAACELAGAVRTALAVWPTQGAPQATLWRVGWPSAIAYCV